MSDSERKEIVRIFKILEANGAMERITYNHDVYWPQNHKFFGGFANHKAFINDLAAAMKRINPSVDLPYWNFYLEWLYPQLSIIWDYFGTAGTKDTDYCVMDGLLPNLTCLYPEAHCLKREWIEKHGKKVMDIWEPCEWWSSIAQMGVIAKVYVQQILALIHYTTDSTILADRIKLLLELLSSNDTPVQLFGQLGALVFYFAHFKTHLSIGGWAGDMSVPIATNDPVFFLFHEGAFMDFLRWQLQDDRNLCPKSYNLGFAFSYENYSIYNADIDKDNLLPYSNMSVKEAFLVGYGNYCYIHEELIEPINNIINNKKQELPIAVQRLKECLSPQKFERYFPKFALCPDKVTAFDYDLPDVGNCNAKQPNGTCRPMKVAKKFTDTANGRRQWELFKYDKDTKLDITPLIIPEEAFYEEFMRDLIDCGYCSPYA